MGKSLISCYRSITQFGLLCYITVLVILKVSFSNFGIVSRSVISIVFFGTQSVGVDAIALRTVPCIICFRIGISLGISCLLLVHCSFQPVILFEECLFFRAVRIGFI